MALENVEGRVLIRWEADTSQYRRELGELQATERKERTERDKALKDTSKQFNAISAGIHKTAAEANKLKEKWTENAESVSHLGKGIDLVGAKVKEFGKSMVSGLVVGFGAGLLGGSVQSLVQKLFEPPTDEDLEKLASLKGDLDSWGTFHRMAAQGMLENRRATALAAEATKEYKELIESFTHKNEFAVLQAQAELALSSIMDGSEEAWTALDHIYQKMNDLSGITQSTTLYYKVFYDTLANGFKKVIENNTRLFREGQKKVPVNDTDEFGFYSSEYAADKAAHQNWLKQQELDEKFAERKRRLQVQMSDFSNDPSLDTSDDFMASMRAAGGEAKESWLAKTIGPIEEFDAYQTAFSMISGSMSSAYEAIIDGNMSASQAVSVFLKSAIKGFGQQMLVRALQETAEGFASLAFGPIGGASASMHFKAAAMFAGGAAVAGAIAGSISTGGGGAGVGPGAAPSFSGQVGTQGGNNYYFTIGDINADDSPSLRAQKFKRNLQLAGIPDSGGSDSVRFG